jgi:hypothetical protein
MARASSNSTPSRLRPLPRRQTRHPAIRHRAIHPRQTRHPAIRHRAIHPRQILRLQTPRRLIRRRAIRHRLILRPVNPPPPAPPVIVTAPASVVANYGTPVALTVQATVTGSPRYQWVKDGAALRGQTSSTLWIQSLCAKDAGVYHVCVTDDVGTVVSSDATVTMDTIDILPSSFDLWDSHTGAVITGHSDYLNLGSAEGMFGADSSDGVTYFADGQPQGAQHFVEWTTATPVQVNTIRLFAHGDGPDFANRREFGAFTLKAKSPGSATFDITVGTFTPTHPYTLLDPNTFAILDTDIAPVVATAFRAEFAQFGSAGPRILELDAFSTRPEVVPAIVVNPLPQSAIKKTVVKFHVAARGGALRYQWKFNGLAIAGATSDCLSIDTAKRPDQGNYSVVVSNDLGSVESAPAFLTILNRH